MTTIEEVQKLWQDTCEDVKCLLTSAAQNTGARLYSYRPDVDSFIEKEINEKYQGLMTQSKSYVPVVYRYTLKDLELLRDADSTAYFSFINSFDLYGISIDAVDIIYFSLIGVDHNKEDAVNHLRSDYTGGANNRCITFMINTRTGRLLSYRFDLAVKCLCPGHCSVGLTKQAKDWQWKHSTELLRTSKVYVTGRLACEAFMYKFGADSPEVCTSFTTNEKFLQTEMCVAEHITERDSDGNTCSVSPVIDHKYASTDFHVYEKTKSGRTTNVLIQDITLFGATLYLKCDMKLCPDCGSPYFGDWCPNCYVTTEDTGNLKKKTDCFEYDGHYYETKQNMQTCCICGKQVHETHGKKVHGKYFVCDRHDIADDTLHYMEDYNGVTGVISDYHSNDTPIKYFIIDNKEIVSYSKRGYCNMFGSENSFKGLGFELEVDKCQFSGCERSIYNNLTADYILSDTGLDEDELFFEYDGSLDDGFEIISQPHTEKAFWQREPEFRKMLSILKKAGYHSHDAGTCGLHLHISKSYFGDTEQKQNFNIAKIYKFYDEYWSDIKVASRRRDTCYCDLNKLESRNVMHKSDKKEVDKVHEWTHQADMDKRTHHHSSSHHVALNNSHDETFEIRLGRGTLNEASFFSWIDLTLTLVHNCTKSSDKLKDAKEWLKGIKATTAIYLLRRGCFTAAVEQLFPDIAEAMRNNSDQTRD